MYHPERACCCERVHAPLVQMSVILLNLVTGPPLFRAAIVAVGEARALQLPSLAGDVFDDVPFQRTPSMPKTASKCVLSLGSRLGARVCKHGPVVGREPV